MADSSARNGDEITRLQELLLEQKKEMQRKIDEAKITNTSLRKQLENTGQSSTSIPEISLLLKMLPIEIRKMIYKLLLVNDDLNDSKLFGKDTDHGAKTKFNLCSSLLRTSRVIYEEASSVLYGSNTFAMICVEKDGDDYPYIPRSPLTRYLDGDEYATKFLDFRTLPAFKKVKHWRFVMIEHGYPHSEEPNDWVFFYRALILFPPTSLHLVVAHYDSPIGEKTSTARLENLAVDLMLINNIEKFTLKDATEEDVPPGIFHSSSFLGRSSDELRMKIEKESQESLRNTTVHAIRIYPMHDKLLEYVRCFERDERFRRDLGSVYSYSPPSNRNPFNYEGVKHSLEGLLAKAERAAYLNEEDLFRENRTRILKYLEPHFQRVAKKIFELGEWVRWQQQHSGILEPYHNRYGAAEHEIVDYTYALVLLRECSKKFERKLDTSTKITILRHKTRFDHAYDELLRERNLRKMAVAFKLKDWEEVIECFKTVVDDMYSQYQDMCKARKELFKSDPEEDEDVDVDIDIDVSKGVHEGLFNWSTE